MVLIRNSQRQRKIDRTALARIVGSILQGLSLGDRDISLLLVSNRQIARLNNEYFQKKRPTNVISFGYEDAMAGEVMGDIIVSVERAAEEADEAGLHFYERLLALIVHGIVHVLGFDHVNGRQEARRMRYRERKLMAAVRAHPLYGKLLGKGEEVRS